MNYSKSSFSVIDQWIDHTAHSKYAALTTPVARITPRDPPVLAVSTPSQPSFLAAASRGQTTTDTVVPAKVHRRRNPLTSRQLYQYMYLPTRFRERISSLRKKLRQLKLDNGRILDVHYPDNNIVALLVHNDYAVDAAAILAKSGLNPIANFDPRAEFCLRGPAFASLTKEQRKEKMVDVHQKRLLKVLEHIHEANRPSVTRAFLKLS
ncbi:hypothetical protein G6F36_010531 [Rhizopus arrhizus]|nr:hypothetical protein G6F36_010531 [Rhizopus arrhizus]